MTWLERHAAELEAWAERMNREIKARGECARRGLGQRMRWMKRVNERIKRGN